MAITTFDTLKLSEDFTHAGFEEKKARVLAETFGKLANENVTKRQFDVRNYGRKSILKQVGAVTITYSIELISC